MGDPMEAIIAQALNKAGVGYSRDLGGGNPTGLDFGLENGVQIEVKRFHTDRIAQQMARADNVIAVQGEGAVNYFGSLFEHNARPEAKLAKARVALETIAKPQAKNFVAYDIAAKALKELDND